MLTSVLLTILPLYLRAQHLRDLPDLVEGEEHRIMADKVLVDDHDDSWRDMTVVWA